MAKLAAADQPGWSASRIELDRDGPSYTFDTLVELHETVAEGSQIFFITGADAFAEIATWSRYPAVLDLAHFVVVSRPGITLDSLRERVPSAFSRCRRRSRPASSRQPQTRVILVEAHTPDVSSTDIRRRARAGESLADSFPNPSPITSATHRLYLGPQNAQTAQN